MFSRSGSFVACGLLLGALLAGCTTTACDCADPIATVVITQMPASPIVTLTADAPCSASQHHVAGKVEIHISADARNRGDSGSCDVHETLADGTMMVATLDWRQFTDCCAGTEFTGPAPVFRTVDGAP